MSGEEKKDVTTIKFGTEDFFSEMQQDSFMPYFDNIEDKEKFIKESTINRVLVEQQTDREKYKKFIYYIQVMGVENILEKIEGKKEKNSLCENDVERIVQRIIKDKQLILQNTSNNQTPDVGQVVEKHNDSKRKKPSSKLKNL